MALRLGVPTTPMSVARAAEPADHAVPRRPTAAVLAARPAGRSPLARPACAPSSGPSGSSDARFATMRRPLAQLRRAGQRAQRRSSPPRPLAEWGADLRPRGRVVGAGAARPRDRRRPGRAGGRWLRRRPAPTADDTVEMVASPVDFAARRGRPRSMSPEFAQHTEEVLLELGYDWDRHHRAEGARRDPLSSRGEVGGPGS